jgi:hypothetical protein
MRGSRGGILAVQRRSAEAHTILQAEVTARHRDVGTVKDNG